MISSVSVRAIRKAGSSMNAIRAAGTLNYSFASPEADFYNSYTPRVEVPSCFPAWTRSLSYGTPENDFVAAAIADKPEESVTEWSGKLSFASPEADFTSEPEASDFEWSESMSFASPEADFTSQPQAALECEWSHQLSFASPESDFVAHGSLSQPQDLLGEHNEEEAEALRSLMVSPVMSLAIVSPESASGTVYAHQLLQQHEMYQLHQERTSSPPLPSTLEEALADNDRAIVVTEAQSPFTIVDVNDAWVGLCGFSREEARHRSLALIQGPETNQRVLAYMLDDLMHGQEATALVTNYDKSGRKFYNKLKAGPIKDAHNRTTHFVGILQEVTEQPEYFHMAA